MEEQALKELIDKAAKKGWTKLDLSKKRLTNLPAEIGNLTNLNTLDLSYNGLGSLPAEIWKLTNLTILNLNNNGLGSLPAEIGNLTNLIYLALNDNGLGSLPAEIGNLTNLNTLDLSYNGLGSLPAEIWKLTNLKELFLRNNDLEELPAEIGNLTNLNTLDLSYNGLGSLPAEIGNLTNLNTLDLDNNNFPDIILSLKERGMSELLAYLRSLKQGNPLYEAKLVLVGEGNVGKTSLLAALRGEDFVKGRSTTHGIEIKTLEIGHPKQDTYFTLNAWDFGGQPLYRITHQFFFSRRCLYLVVWWPREGSQKNEVREWIKRIELRVGKEARVLVVATHCTENSRLARIDEAALKDEFGDMLVGFHQVDSNDGAGIDSLKTAIANTACNLSHMGEMFSSRWKAAQDKILASPEPRISVRMFDDACKSEGLDEQDTEALALLMHDLGHIIYYRDDEDLRDVVVLKPEWLTKAISYILEDKSTNDAYGVLDHASLERIWCSHGRDDYDTYDPKFHPYFLRLMEKFDVSYRLEGGKTSLVSQLVPYEQPDLTQLDLEGTELKMVCSMLAEPTGIIPWMIVRTHRYSTGLHWQGGMELRYDPHGTALLQTEPRGLAITVNSRYPAYFMSLLSDSLTQLIKERWPGLKHELTVPCPELSDGKPCEGLLRLPILHKRRSKNKTETECNVCGEDLSISKLLTGFAPESSHEEQLRQVNSRLEVMTKQSEAITKQLEAASQERQQYASETAETARLLLHAMASETRDCPRLFTLLPTNLSKWNPSNLGKIGCRLNLWCEHPDHEHPTCRIGSGGQGEYTFTRPGEELSKLAPYASMVAKTLKILIPVGGAVLKAILDESLAKDIGSQLDIMGKLPGAFLSGNFDISKGSSLREGLTMQATGHGLRELHTLLLELDPAKNWGGLRRIFTSSGDYLWVCPKHYKEYNPGLPDLSSNQTRYAQLDTGKPENQDRVLVMEKLTALLPAQLEKVRFRLGIPAQILPGADAAAAVRAIAMIEYAEQGDPPLALLKEAIEEEEG